jgi:hypothetical protein
MSSEKLATEDFKVSEEYVENVGANSSGLDVPRPARAFTLEEEDRLYRKMDIRVRQHLRALVRHGPTELTMCDPCRFCLCSPSSTCFPSWVSCGTALLHAFTALLTFEHISRLRADRGNIGNARC